jgi:hypothetical protein
MYKQNKNPAHYLLHFLLKKASDITGFCLLPFFL